MCILRHDQLIVEIGKADIRVESANIHAIKTAVFSTKVSIKGFALEEKQNVPAGTNPAGTFLYGTYKGTADSYTVPQRERQQQTQRRFAHPQEGRPQFRKQNFMAGAMLPCGCGAAAPAASRSCSFLRKEKAQTPCAIMAAAIFSKPAMLAPATRLPFLPYFSAAS